MINELSTAVISCIIRDGSCLSDIALTESDFKIETHRAIFSAACQLESSKEPIDVISIAELLQKQTGKNDFRDIPNGAGGVEHRLALLHTYGVLPGKISLNSFVALTSTNAAKIFGLFPSKGTISIGSDADIIVWNPQKENTISVKSHYQNCDINIYEGVKTVGASEFVISNGNIVLQNGKILSNIENGKFLETNPF